MGKETPEEPKNRGALEHRPSSGRSNLLYEDMLFAELSRLWTSREGVTSVKEVKEDGQVSLTIQRQGEEWTFLCSGFANVNNKCTLLLQRLLQAGLLSPGCSIESFCVRKSSMWFHFDVRASSFSSGDSLLLVLGTSASHSHSHSRKRREGKSGVTRTHHEIRKAIGKFA